MAVTFPEIPEYKNEAERIALEAVSKSLDENCVVYFNYNIGILEFDIAAFVLNQGICIIEVKAWRSSNLVKVKDNNCIIYKAKKNIILNSPFKQANQYRYAMIDKIKNELNENVMVVPMVCYPNITRSDFYRSNLHIISPEEFVIFKEEIEDKTILKNKILNSFLEAKKFINLGSCSFDYDTLNNVRNLFEPNLVLEEPSYRDDIVVEGNHFEDYTVKYALKKMSNNDLLELINECSKCSNKEKLLIISDSQKVINMLKVLIKRPFEYKISRTFPNFLT